MKKIKKQTHIENSNMPNKNEHIEYLEKSYQSSTILGTLTILLIFGLFGMWSVLAELETTITAEGKVITRSYNKIVMHPNGGIIKKVFIEEGENVKKDQPLFELDSTEYQSQLASNIKKYDKNLFSICKFEAQFNLKDNLDCTEVESAIIEKNKIEKLKNDTNSLFLSDMKSLEVKIGLLESKNDVLGAENNGLDKQIASNQRLLESYKKELTKWNMLLKDNAVDELKSIETQRQIEHSILQIGTLQSKKNENIALISSHLKQVEVDYESFKNTVLSKKNDLELENQIIYDKITSLRNTIENLTIKSPSNGLVIDMKVHAAREVVSPQKPILSIVPTEKDFIIEAYVMPTDIEKIFKDQETEVSFPAFIDPSAIPIEGQLIYISADAITLEESRGASIYRILVKITPKGFNAIAKNDFKIIPGMPSTVFIKTGKTTLLEYLTQPIVQMFKGIYNAN